MIDRALFIGIDKYDQLGDLKYCGADAKSFAKVVGDLKAFGLTHRSIQTVTSEKGLTSREGLLKALANTLNENEGNREGILLYFAGHGMEVDGNPHLLPSDFDPTLPTLSSIEVNYLISEIRRAEIKSRVFIFDSCYSGLHRGERSTPNEDFEKYQSSFARAFDLFDEGTAVLSSASISEKAREQKFSQDQGHGVFTHSLLESIGELKVGANAGAIANVEQLHGRAYKKTVLISNGNQHPRFFYSIGAPLAVFQTSKMNRSPARDSSRVTESSEKRIKALLQSLSKKNPELQRVAAEKIVEHGSEAVAGLVEKLGHSRQDVRDWAAYCLGEIGNREAIVPLLGALRDRTSRSRKGPLSTKASPALIKFGDSVIKPCLSYMEKTSLNRTENERITNVLNNVWSGKNGPASEAIFRHVVDFLPQGISTWKKTPFLVKKSFELLEGYIEEELERLTEKEKGRYSPHIYKSRNVGRRIMKYLLINSPQKFYSTIANTKAFKESPDFLASVLITCNPVESHTSKLLLLKAQEQDRIFEEAAETAKWETNFQYLRDF